VDTETATGVDTQTDSVSETESGLATDTRSAEMDGRTDDAADAGQADQCLEREDFSACRVDTTDVFGVDYDNDICVDETCISVGICNDAMCNAPGRQYRRVVIRQNDENGCAIQ
jgi:hypothetical protein